ncbi:MAG: inorganic phosphate transporter [Acidobacteria bacterium]|nr:inorganic phosphate transporter [Acidobacteriota bacterium]
MPAVDGVMTLAVLTVVGAAVLAFANGANDVSKGVATLAGSGRASYRSALAWGALWTFAGGLASLMISVGLVEAFTSAIVGPEVLALSAFPLAVAVGAAAWVVLASVIGLPVSTTHALIGAIVGVALIAGGRGSVNWWMLLSGIAAPLALSPVVSAVIGYGMHAVAGRISPTCVCVQADISAGPVHPGGTIAGVLAPRIVASASGCAPADGGWRFMPAGVLHWGAAATLSFARGVNDNAKLAAIGALGFSTLGAPLWVAFAVTAAVMTIGSYAAGLRVTRTLGERVVHMDQDTGLAAALVAAGLVMAASFYTLPVSTTHVSTGAIVGAGLRQGRGAVEWRHLGSLVTAWVGTVPVAAALAAVAAWLMAALG